MAPAKPNRPIPFDLNDKRWNITGQIVFFICHRAHTDLYRVYTGFCPAWYRTLRPPIVIAYRSHRVLTMCIPPSLKYVMLHWNIYCCSEIYIAALKYVLPLWNIIAAPKYILPIRNMLSRRHAHVRKPSLCSKLWAPPHERVHNGLIPAHVLLPCSYRVLTVCHRLYPPGEKFWVCPKLSPGLAGSCRPLTGHWRVHRSINAPPCALTMFHRPHKIYHTVAGAMWRLHYRMIMFIYQILFCILSSINAKIKTWVKIEYLPITISIIFHFRNSTMTGG